MNDTERPEGAPPEGKEHLAPTQDAGIADIPDEIEITIEDEPAPQEEAPAEQPKPKHRPRSDPQRRIDQLTARRQEAETRAQQLERENQELLARFEKGGKDAEVERAARVAAERAALIHHEHAQKLEKEAAERDLEAANERADNKAQAEAIARLTAATSRLDKIAEWKAANPEVKPQARQEPTQERPREEPRREAPRQRTVADLDPPAKDWMADNPWFDPGHDYYDQDMHLAAVQHANTLEQRLARQGKQAEINTPAYFAKLTNLMKADFPDYDWGDEPSTVVPALSATTTPPTRHNGAARMPQMSRPNAVVPANGQQTPGAKPQGDRVRVAMSDDEKEMAVKQWENGAMGNHWKTGKPIANKSEAVDQWAYRKALRAKSA